MSQAPQQKNAHIVLITQLCNRLKRVNNADYGNYEVQDLVKNERLLMDLLKKASNINDDELITVISKLNSIYNKGSIEEQIDFIEFTSKHRDVMQNMLLDQVGLVADILMERSLNKCHKKTVGHILDYLCNEIATIVDPTAAEQFRNDVMRRLKR